MKLIWFTWPLQLCFVNEFNSQVLIKTLECLLKVANPHIFNLDKKMCNVEWLTQVKIFITLLVPIPSNLPDILFTI